MRERPDARATRVMQAIRSYLSQHPDAADSEQGIAEWWLPSMHVDASVAEVAVALQHLHRTGVVERQVLPDGQVIYRRCTRPCHGIGRDEN